MITFIEAMMNCISYEGRNKKLNELIMLLGKNSVRCKAAIKIGWHKNYIMYNIIQIKKEFYEKETISVPGDAPFSLSLQWRHEQRQR